jgi:P-type Cu2+ transporter
MEMLETKDRSQGPKSDRLKHAGHVRHGMKDKETTPDLHTLMIGNFRRRFWISLIITIPILLLSPMIQMFLGSADVLRFPGSLYIPFSLSSIVFF